jgi:hypothetical protein
LDWIGLAQDKEKWRALVNAGIKFCVLQNVKKISCDYATGVVSSSAQLQAVSYLVFHFFKVQSKLDLLIHPFLPVRIPLTISLHQNRHTGSTQLPIRMSFLAHSHSLKTAKF